MAPGSSKPGHLPPSHHLHHTTPSYCTSSFLCLRPVFQLHQAGAGPPALRGGAGKHRASLRPAIPTLGLNSDQWRRGKSLLNFTMGEERKQTEAVHSCLQILPSRAQELGCHLPYHKGKGMRQVPERFYKLTYLCLAHSRCLGGHPASISSCAGAEGLCGAGAMAGGVSAAGALSLCPHLLPAPGLDPPAAEG